MEANYEQTGEDSDQQRQEKKSLGLAQRQLRTPEGTPVAPLIAKSWQERLRGLDHAASRQDKRQIDPSTIARLCLAFG